MKTKGLVILIAELVKANALRIPYIIYCDKECRYRVKTKGLVILIVELVKANVLYNILR